MWDTAKATCTYTSIQLKARYRLGCWIMRLDRAELSLYITIILPSSQLSQHPLWRCDISILLEFNLALLNKTIAYRPFPKLTQSYFNHMELNNYSLTLDLFWQQSWQVVCTAHFPSSQIQNKNTVNGSWRWQEWYSPSLTIYLNKWGGREKGALFDLYFMTCFCFFIHVFLPMWK